MLQILHCDVSDFNFMFNVQDASPEAVVPNWPEGEGVYPKRPGMLGDWGYAADLAGSPVIRRITVSTCYSLIFAKFQSFAHRMQGTFPYMATDFLSPEKKNTHHTVHHDLESFFWILWIVCINMNGPFYTRRRWQDEKSSSKKDPVQSLPSGIATTTTSSAFTDVSLSGHSSVSHSQISTISHNSAATTEMAGSLVFTPEPQLSQPTPHPLKKHDTFREQSWSEPINNIITRLPFGEEEAGKHAPPIWATPGRHDLGPLDVFHSKRTISEDTFLNCISPYFRQSGPVFLDGLKTLHTYFVKMRSGEGAKLKEEMGEITHQKFCEILKNMRDSISPDIDRTSNRDIKIARERYKKLSEAGGVHGIAISVLDTQQPRVYLSKRSAEEQGDNKAPRKKISRARRG